MGQYVSFIVQSWRDGRDGTMRWQVHCAQGEEEIRFPDATCMVRTWIDDDGQVIRGLIRHLTSGREMQFQSSKRAVAFVRAWLSDDPSLPIEPDLDALEEVPISPPDTEQKTRSTNGRAL
jgi:hypothetical protein